MEFNSFARVTVLVNLTDEPLDLFECQRVLDPKGLYYLPIKLKPDKNKPTTISASRLLNHQGSSDAARTLKIKRHKHSGFEKDFLRGKDILNCTTVYFYKDTGGADIKIYMELSTGGILADVGRMRAFRWFRRPPVLTEVPGNDQNAPSDQPEL